MKKQLLILILIFSFGNLHSTNKLDEFTFSGTYEGIIEQKNNRGFYGLGGNKSLVRFHLYRYKYANNHYVNKYDRVSKKTAYPRTIVCLIEVYENKRGKGKPEKFYFTAISYESTNALEIERFSSPASNKYGDLQMIRHGLRKFIIPKSDLQSFKISLPNLPETTFKKIKTFKSVPQLFDSYFNISLEEMKSKSENVIYLGHNGSPYSNRLIFHNYSVRDAIIKANMIYRNTSKYGLNNPSLSWLDDLEYEIKNVLKNKYYGAHTLLHFLPNLNQMEISINTNNSNSEAYKESTHFFDVEIDRKIKGIDYTISLNKNANSYITKAQKADSERKIIAEKRYLEKLRLQKIQEEKKRLAAEEEKRKMLIMLSEETATGEPTEKQMKFAVSTNLGVKMGFLKSPAKIQLNESSGSVEAILKLIGMGFEGYELEIVTFKKNNCFRVGNTTEFECNYNIKINMGGKYGSIYGAFSNAINNTQSKTSRFKKLKNIWVLTD